MPAISASAHANPAPPKNARTASFFQPLIEGDSVISACLGKRRGGYYHYFRAACPSKDSSGVFAWMTDLHSLFSVDNFSTAGQTCSHVRSPQPREASQYASHAGRAADGHKC